MYILTLETTGPHASAAIIDENRRVESLSNPGVLNHLETLMPMVEELLNKCKLQIGDMACIAASSGPGSFTGIRIGVSTARALAQAVKVKNISVPTLKAFAYNMGEQDRVICPILDARRKQVYGGAFKWKDGQVQEIVESGAWFFDEYLEKLKATGEKEFVFFGDGIKIYKDDIEAADISAEIAPEEVRFQTAESAAQVALDMYKAGQLIDFNEFLPNYMRKPEAQRQLEEKKRRLAAEK